MASSTLKIHENWLRAAAARQGLRLARSRRRDPRATDYGRYRLLDRATGSLVLDWSTPTEVEHHLFPHDERGRS